MKQFIFLSSVTCEWIPSGQSRAPTLARLSNGLKTHAEEFQDNFSALWQKKIEWNFIEIPGIALTFTVLQISVTIAVWISAVLRDQSCRTVGQANKTENQSTENSTNANDLVECKVR